MVLSYLKSCSNQSYLCQAIGIICIIILVSIQSEYQISNLNIISKINSKLRKGRQLKWTQFLHETQTMKKDTIVVTLTTVPERLISNTFKNVILRIINQTVKPSKILLNIPMIYKRTNKTYLIPDWIYNYSNIIKVNRCDDIGPITKLLGGFHKINDNSLIIVADDDIMYVDTWIENLFASYKQHKNESNNILVHYMKEPYGFSGYLIQKHTIKNILNHTRPNSCYYVDDDYLIWYYNQLNVTFIRCDKEFWDLQETDKHPKWFELCRHTPRKILQKQCITDLIGK